MYRRLEIIKKLRSIFDVWKVQTVVVGSHCFLHVQITGVEYFKIRRKSEKNSNGKNDDVEKYVNASMFNNERIFRVS